MKQSIVHQVWCIVGFLVVITLYTLFTLQNTAYAESEFSTYYDVTYQVQADGITQVTEKISLKNLTPNFYAQNFIITIGATNLTEVSATDSSGGIEVKQEVKGTKTDLTLKLNQQVVGENKLQNFELKFKSKDFAQKVGKTWEVTLPKPPISNIEQYNLTLLVPVQFADPTSISPKPKSSQQIIDNLSFFYDQAALNNSGVSASFGQYQFFDFNLSYNLTNSSILPTTTTIPLPPNTQYQQVLIDQIEPKPLNVRIDPDGNLLAEYRLAKRSLTQVKIAGKAKLQINPSQLSQLSPDQVKQYTKQDKYWSADGVIQAKLGEIFAGQKPTLNRDKARLIYQFLVSFLKYDTNRLKGSELVRLGAVTALNNPDQAVCMEFTDLFIALARAAGVPARELDGYAYTENRTLRPTAIFKDGKLVDFLHTWPEYWDEKKGWVMVDPTWENTSGGVDYFNKFDLSHLVLAIRGVTSQAPITSDQVEVKIGDETFKPQSNVEVEFDTPNPLWSGFPNSGKLVFVNNGNAISSPEVALVDTSGADLVGANKINLPPLPPQGRFEVSLGLKTKSIFNNSEGSLVVTVNNQGFKKELLIKPIFLFKGYPYIYLGVVALILTVYGAVLGIHYYQKKKV